MKTALKWCCIFTCLLLPGCSRPDTAAPPNVVLVTIDALRADALSYAGYPLKTSPNLDRLAAESVVFSQALTTFPGTAPSMASLMTGLFPSFESVNAWTRPTRHGFNEFESPGERELSGLSDNVRMLAEILGETGYTTLGFTTNPNLSIGDNFDQGFEEYEQFLPFLRRARKDREHPLIGSYPDAKVVLGAVRRYLERDFEEPVFMWIHLMEPHSPYLPPEKFARRFSGRDTGFSDLEINESYYHLVYTVQGNLGAAARYPSPEERGVPPGKFVGHLRALYDAEVRYCDAQLRRLFKLLREHSLWDDTLLIITADHGEEFFEHGHVGHHVESGLTEELLRIPAIIRPPGGQRPGKSIDNLVRLVDFAPTILDYAGLENEIEGMDGVSLRPLIEGRSMAPLTAYFSTIDYGLVRDERWKYRLIKTASANGEAREQLFDIVADPLESSDLAQLHPEIVERMREQYRDFAFRLSQRRPPDGGHVRSRSPVIDSETRERLEALGYTSD